MRLLPLPKNVEDRERPKIDIDLLRREHRGS